MGLRGPLRKPDSVRGKKAAAAEIRLAAQQAEHKAKRLQGTAAQPGYGETPVKPIWMSVLSGDIWQNLLDLLLAAGVPVKGIDTYALAMAAQCLAGVACWAAPEDIAAADIEARLGMAKLSQKFQVDAAGWLDKLGATPSSRLRMGIKPVVAKQEGALAQLLAARQLRKRGTGAA